MKTKKKSGVVDYAAVADTFAESDDESPATDHDEEEDDDQQEDDECEDDGDNAELVDDRSDASPDESEESDSLEREEEGSSDEGDEEEDDGEASSEKRSVKLRQGTSPPASTTTGENCTFDLRNLLGVNSHQVNTASLYSKKAEKKQETVTISPDRLGVVVDEEYLLEKATDGCSQLLSALWQLPVERSDAGPMVSLPSYDEMQIPRALPPPPPKQESKWEKFAKEKGIPVNKNKRSRKVWDEATGTWMYRHGYQKANDDSKEWPIMEVKGTEDPYEDPWERQREAKRTRVEKNTSKRMRNQERAGFLPKGTTNKLLKTHEKTRQAGKAGGNLDRDNVAPVGVPVDLKARKGTDALNSSKRGKESTVAALLATQRSTASLGQFDKMREGEPERKKALSRLKKKKFVSSTDKKVVASEAERSLKLLHSIVDGGGSAKEKAKKTGKLATGETAYDYDFDDGLGPSSFRKKKGRAGAGKMKKMTKKRAK